MGEQQESKVTLGQARQSGSRYLPKKTILLVEDDRDMIAILQGFFAQISVQIDVGISVEVLGDGRKAIDNLVERPFDLVFLDLGLPFVPGHQVLRRSRAVAVYTPIFILSSSNNKSDVHRAYDYGANGYLYKGGSPAILQAALLSVCQCYLKYIILPVPL